MSNSHLARITATEQTYFKTFLLFLYYYSFSIKAWVANRTNTAKKHGRGKTRDEIDFMTQPQAAAALLMEFDGDAGAMWAFCGVSSKTAFGKVKAPEVRKQLAARSPQ
eukprot:COSAG01_NODE_12204_length_1780_cov_6.759072_2_plen_108_part_00